MPDDPRKHVLLVEDEDNIALALEILITRAGYDLRRVRDGASALEALQSAPPDLVVLDAMIPNGSGVEICQHIREDARLSAVPILMVSAAGPAAERKALALGADAFLLKPFDTRDLTREIARLLGEAGDD